MERREFLKLGCLGIGVLSFGCKPRFTRYTDKELATSSQMTNALVHLVESDEVGVKYFSDISKVNYYTMKPKHARECRNYVVDIILTKKDGYIEISCVANNKSKDEFGRLIVDSLKTKSVTTKWNPIVVNNINEHRLATLTSLRMQSYFKKVNIKNEE